LLPPQIYSPHIVTGVAWAAPCVYIEDYPRFPWRGCDAGCGAPFFNKDNVKQVLDAVAMHKLNTFHWHLVDDQGWRLQLTNNYPNLTITGAWERAWITVCPRGPRRNECRRTIWRLLHAG